VVVAWTLCTLVASFGCRCGTFHDSPAVAVDPAASPPPHPYNPFDPEQSPTVTRRARIDAIKTDILGKLGLEDAEDGKLPEPAANVTTDETGRVMRLYQQSVDQLRGTSHRLPGDVKQRGTAKRFFSFTAVQPGNQPHSHHRSHADCGGRRDIDLCCASSVTSEINITRRRWC